MYIFNYFGYKFNI